MGVSHVTEPNVTIGTRGKIQRHYLDLEYRCEMVCLFSWLSIKLTKMFIVYKNDRFPRHVEVAYDHGLFVRRLRHMSGLMQVESPTF